MSTAPAAVTVRTIRRSSMHKCSRCLNAASTVIYLDGSAFAKACTLHKNIAIAVTERTAADFARLAA